MSSECRQFASDNYAGICPEAWAAMAEANAGYSPSYGEDVWTKRAADMIRGVFETDCQVFFVFNGTSANSLSLASLCQSYHSVLCHQTAHIETDECGAPEFFSNGTKILQLPGEQGKITPAAISHAVTRRQDIHYPKPQVVSITQATELGTLYSPDELRAITECARKHKLHVHMDGARFANALASLNVQPKEISWQAGVDVLSLGGTKNGGGMGEAVVFFNTALAADFEYRCKQAGQLASKMRFLAAPWAAMLKDGTWLKHARHANDMADALARRIADLPGARILYPRQANSIFVELPDAVIRDLHTRGWHFYTFIGGAARLMTSWATQPQEVDDFVRDLKASLAGKN